MLTKSKSYYPTDKKVVNFVDPYSLEGIVSSKVEWQNRALAQFLYDNYLDRNIYFLTLTYSDDCLPHFTYNNHTVQCFSREHIKGFFKGVRDWLRHCPYDLQPTTTKDSYYSKYPISYLCCSEFGEHTKRPHYHLLISVSKNVPIKELCCVFQSTWKYGFVFPSPDKCLRDWYDRYGAHHNPMQIGKDGDIGSIVSACCYTAKYACKDIHYTTQNGSKELEADINKIVDPLYKEEMLRQLKRVAPFTRASLHFGECLNILLDKDYISPMDKHGYRKTILPSHLWCKGILSSANTENGISNGIFFSSPKGQKTLALPSYNKRWFCTKLHLTAIDKEEKIISPSFTVYCNNGGSPSDCLEDFQEWLNVYSTKLSELYPTITLKKDIVADNFPKELVDILEQNTLVEGIAPLRYKISLERHYLLMLQKPNGEKMVCRRYKGNNNAYAMECKHPITLEEIKRWNVVSTSLGNITYKYLTKTKYVYSTSKTEYVKSISDKLLRDKITHLQQEIGSYLSIQNSYPLPCNATALDMAVYISAYKDRINPTTYSGYNYSRYTDICKIENIDVRFPNNSTLEDMRDKAEQFYKLSYCFVHNPLLDVTPLDVEGELFSELPCYYGFEEWITHFQDYKESVRRTRLKKNANKESIRKKSKDCANPS